MRTVRRHPDGYLVKLVRDNVARVLGGDGTITYRPMTRAEHIVALRAKLIEEAIEYAANPTMDELAHVFEVVRCLCVVEHRRMFARLVTIATAQAQERGGYEGAVGMYATHPRDHEEVDDAR